MMKQVRPRAFHSIRELLARLSIPPKQQTTLCAHIFLILTALLCPIWYASAQEKSATPSKEEARNLLARAAEATDLRAAGSAPFHFRGKAKSIGPKGKVLEGDFEIWWSSADQWRQEFNWSGISYVEIADRGRLWRKGDDVHRFDAVHVLRTLDFGPGLKIPVSEKIEHVRRKKIDGIPAYCIGTPLNYLNITISSGTILLLPPDLPDQRVVCVQASTSLPLRIEVGSSRTEYENYVELGTKRFPRTIRKIEDNKILREVEIKLVETLVAAPTDLFVPPTDAVSRAWCPNMVLPRLLRSGRGSEFPSGIRPSAPMLTFPPGEIHPGLFVFDVDDRGRAVRVEEYDSNGRVLLKDSTKRELLKSIFQPATCQGIPLEVEFEM